jgi:hypothetical protein
LFCPEKEYLLKELWQTFLFTVIKAQEFYVMVWGKEYGRLPSVQQNIIEVNNKNRKK